MVSAVRWALLARRVHYVSEAGITDGTSYSGKETSLDLIITIIVGGIIGWLASIVMKTNAQMGLLMNIIVGIVGSLIGFWLAGMLGIAAGGVMRWVVGVIGAMILIGVLKALNVLR
jgi:uncharacterized membrane protein YeaQ/YmgE (transglycosylase-associated protein family)